MPSEGMPDDLAQRVDIKRVRLAMILDHVATAPAAHNAKEAHEMLVRIFAENEAGIKKETDGRGPMHIVNLDTMEDIEHNGRTILHHWYNKHMLFLGDNGAIEIRASDRRANPLPAIRSPYDELPLVFSKKGADGRGVWDAIIS